MSCLKGNEGSKQDAVMNKSKPLISVPALVIWCRQLMPLFHCREDPALGLGQPLNPRQQPSRIWVSCGSCAAPSPCLASTIHLSVLPAEPALRILFNVVSRHAR